MKKSSRPPFPPKMEMLFGDDTLKQRCNWGKIAQDYQRNLKRIMRMIDADRIMDLSDPMLTRRTRAVVDYTDRVIERYTHIPGLEESHRDDAGDAWLSLNLQPCFTYNLIETRSHILCAAAIWILDQISAQQDWQKKIRPILPTDFTQMPGEHMPDLWDSNYDNDLIQSVIYILRSRNTDIAPMEMDDPVTERVWTSDLIAEGKQHKDVPSRRTFEDLLRLIPTDAINHAVSSFEALLWAWIDRYFACIAPIKSSRQKTVAEANQFARQFNELRDELMDAYDDYRRDRAIPKQERVGKKPVINPLLANPASILGSDLNDFLPDKFLSTYPVMDSMRDMRHFEEAPLHRLLRLVDRMSQIEQQREDLRKRFVGLNEKQITFARYSTMEGCISPEECKQDYGDDVAEHMVPLRISDPYEICFALLWLIENDSDLPWLYGASCGLMQEVSQSLPWGVLEYDNKEDTWDEDDDPWDDDDPWGDEDPCEGEYPWDNEYPGRDDAPYGEEYEKRPSPKRSPKSRAIPDCYERKFSKDGDGSPATMRSLAQILYEETGCIMPRNLEDCDGLLRSLKDYGIEEKDASVMLQLIPTLSSAHGRATSLQLIQNMTRGWEDEESLGEDNASNVEDADEDLSQQLKQLKEENARLRASMHEMEKSSREVKKELSSIRDAANLEHRELADLRELVFNRQADASQEKSEEAIDDKAFPYEVKRNTVVFGGQESWLKAIRPLLTGNIRFVGTFLNFDVGLVRYSDIIWIQTNTLSHKQYYRIIDAARAYSRPVRYFTRSSATNGAAEVMKADQAISKK